MRDRFIILLLLPVIIFSSIMTSCNKSSEAEIPAFIFIDSVGLSTDEFIQGAESQNITDFWVYVDEKPIGVFNKQKLIPIISEDYSKPNIKIYAGIRSNGAKDNVEIYFLYKNIELNKTLTPGEIDTIDAIFTYDSFSKFVFIEGFEKGNIFNKVKEGNAKIKITDEDAIYGKKCGLILLDAENKSIEVTTKKDYFDLPTQGNKVFFEIDYMCNTEFVIGISGKDQVLNEYNQDLIIMKKKENWNKLYLDLSYSIKKAELTSYRIYIKVIHPTELDQTKVYIDNLKLVYLNR